MPKRPPPRARGKENAPRQATMAPPRDVTVQRIRSLQAQGKVQAAITLCEEARKDWPSDAYFAGILGDLYFQKGDHEAAFVSLAYFLGTIPFGTKPLSQFANRYYRFRRVLPKDKMSAYAQLLASSIEETQLDARVTRRALEIIAPDTFQDRILDHSSPQAKNFVALLSNDKNFHTLVRLERRIEEKGPEFLTSLLDEHVLTRARTAQTFRTDLYCVSLYEKRGQHESALKIVNELLTLRLDSVAVRSLFRLCRILKDYTRVDELLTRAPSLIKADDFNILYELVYYFEAKNDLNQVQGVLRVMNKRFAQNHAVLRTLRNFYIRFGMAEDARRIEPAITALGRGAPSGGKFGLQAAESETELASKVQELYSELEHQKQLAAISDLTTGISHELGQPITNIRYTIQFYQKLFKKKVSPEGVLSVFESILEETERMGGLISRLSPLTSSRSVVETFDIMERVRKRLDLEQPRLAENRIRIDISPRRRRVFEYYGDPVKFDQLISNLVLNAIDAIKERKTPGENVIAIRIEEDTKELRLQLSDTGTGVPIANRNKIFDPFFTTKPPGKGEGLGLFIVWNLLKMQGGTISVDSQYTQGARFLIMLPRQAQAPKEET
jgi:signal transduction histidine kinase